MSDYLVGLARRSAGITPVAQPRPRRDPLPALPVTGATAQRVVVPPGAGAEPSDGAPAAFPRREGAALPGSDEAAPGPTIRVVERVGAETLVAGPGVADRAGQVTPTERGTLIPLPVSSEAQDERRLAPRGMDTPGAADDRPRSRTVLEPRPARPPDVSAAAGSPAALTSDRLTPLPAPRKGGSPAALEHRGPGREVLVRIGTIEIHAEAAALAGAGQAPAEPVSSPPPALRGFDGFARLRAYSPWER